MYVNPTSTMSHSGRESQGLLLQTMACIVEHARIWNKKARRQQAAEKYDSKWSYKKVHVFILTERKKAHPWERERRNEEFADSALHRRNPGCRVVIVLLAIDSLQFELAIALLSPEVYTKGGSYIIEIYGKH